MPSLRLALGVILLLLVLVSGYWLWGRLISSSSSWQRGAASAPSATPATPATPTPLQAPRGYRLAGVAVGDPESFAVVEAPNGGNALYRLNDAVPGLGRLVRIEAERIVVDGAGGQFELWIMPAATPTAVATRPSRTLASRTPAPRAAAPQTPSPRRQPPPAGGGTAPRSKP